MSEEPELSEDNFSKVGPFPQLHLSTSLHSLLRNQLQFSASFSSFCQFLSSEKCLVNQPPKRSFMSERGTKMNSRMDPKLVRNLFLI